MQYNDDIINDLFWGNRQFKIRKYNKLIEINKDNDIINYLINRYDNFNSYKETLYRIKHKLENQPKCPICGKELKFINTSKGYNKFCSNTKCKQKNLENKILDKYGVKNVAQLDIVKEKIKNTFITNYGVTNPNKVKKVRDKIKQTCLNKYGVEHQWLNPDIKEKRHQTWLKKYGVDVCSQAECVKEKMSKTIQEKYGVNWFTQSQKLINSSNTEQVKDKEFQTKIKNMKFSKSKEEDKLYELLINKFKIVKRQYKDKQLYPYHCDFYLPIEDIWIEYNGSEFHHGRPYLDNDVDKYEVELLKQKSEQRKTQTGKQKSRYDSIINTWTNLDVKKRNIAKENNLNYIEFWNLNDAINWINNN